MRLPAASLFYRTQKGRVQHMQRTFMSRVRKDMRQNWTAYLLVLPVIAYFIIFHYKPMYGLIIAFKKFSIRKGILGSPWVGFDYFLDFFSSYYFLRLIRNTLSISFSSLIFGFPVPIIFALLLNEVHNQKYKKVIQTVSYMPHFISLVVICSLVRLFTAHHGLLTSFFALFGYDPNFDMLNHKNLFVPIYVGSGIWQNTGWDCIIYLSALAGIDTELYEAARIDGANRWKQTLHVTIPGIMGTVILLLILRIGSLMSVGYEKVILLYNEGIYETADVISSYVYRRGLIQGDYSYSTAVGLFNSLINVTLVVSANSISKRVSGLGLF